MASRALQPHSEIISAAKTIDRLFKAAFSAAPSVYQRESLCGWRSLHSSIPTQAELSSALTQSENTASHSPDQGVHVHETAERFVIEVELPRIKADSLYIEISGDMLIIRGERDLSNTAHQPGRHKKKSGPMVQRYIQLPVEARPGEVRARLEGNTVKVNIKKRSGVF